VARFRQRSAGTDACRPDQESPVAEPILRHRLVRERDPITWPGARQLLSHDAREMEPAATRRVRRVHHAEAARIAPLSDGSLARHRLRDRARLVDPLAIDPAPRLLVCPDNRPAQFADLAGSRRRVGVRQPALTVLAGMLRSLRGKRLRIERNRDRHLDHPSAMTEPLQARQPSRRAAPRSPKCRLHARAKKPGATWKSP